MVQLLHLYVTLGKTNVSSITLGYILKYIYLYFFPILILLPIYFVQYYFQVIRIICDVVCLIQFVDSSSNFHTDAS